MVCQNLLLAALIPAALTAQTQNDWPGPLGDAGGRRFSTLRQIHAANVAGLKPAWTFHTGKGGSEGIPVVAGGRMFVAAANGVFALKPESGELLWYYESTGVALRGLTYWPGASGVRPRVFAGVRQGSMVALDAETGKPVPGFANEGLLDLKKGVLDGLPDGRLALQSPPIVYKGLVITGSSNGEGAPAAGPYGDIRGWDAGTGRLVWTFHTVPRPGEPGYETWPEGAWKNRSGTNTWGFFTLDAARGALYAPIGSPTADFYGVDRHGMGLYGNSLVALDASTGKLKWHQQLVHHDIWDYDPAAPPVLFDSVQGGRRIPAVAQITKMGIMFSYNRVTGQPLFGQEECHVPQSVVPGEKTWPTQPFPLKPAPLARISFSLHEMYSESPEHAKFCRELFEANRMTIGPIYSPMPLEGNVLTFPSTLGGGNWGGFAHDPGLGLLFTNIMNIGQWGHMEKRIDPKTGQETYVRTSAYGPYARFWNRETRVPCSKPPFGEMVAVNANTGEIAWRVPLGRIESLESIGVRNTGTLSLGGGIATAGGLVFIAATNDAYFRAFESKSGRLLWEHKIDANGHTIPVTYQGNDGRQYVVVHAGGGGAYFGGAPGDSIQAFALPGGPPFKETTAPIHLRFPVSKQVSLPEGETAALVRTSCSGTCHNLEVISSQKRTRAEWVRILDAMAARGARVPEGQSAAVVDYLARHFGRP